MPAQIQCPGCKATLNWSAAERFRPFCSERCRLIDLGAWASDQYRLAGAAPPQDEQSDQPSLRSGSGSGSDADSDAQT